MGEVTHSVDVDVELSTAYNQWTQFEEFPRFMAGVEKVEQLDDRHLRWEVDIAGIDREFETEITEQRPDERVAWKSISGADQAGVVTFHRLTDDQTRVTLQMEFEPEGVVETVGDIMGAVSMRTRGDLDRFKDFIEAQGVETGAWRGEIDHDQGTKPPGGGATVQDDVSGRISVEPADNPAKDPHQPDSGFREYPVDEDPEEFPEAPRTAPPPDREPGR